MNPTYLEITYRHGMLLAAYLHLQKDVEVRSAKTEDAGHGLLIDFAADGRAIGIEITAPSRFDLVKLNNVLERLGVEAIDSDEVKPLIAV